MLYQECRLTGSISFVYFMKFNGKKLNANVFFNFGFMKFYMSDTSIKNWKHIKYQFFHLEK